MYSHNRLNMNRILDSFPRSAYSTCRTDTHTAQRLSPVRCDLSLRSTRLRASSVSSHTTSPAPGCAASPSRCSASSAIGAHSRASEKGRPACERGQGVQCSVWPIHDIAITNIVWLAAFKRGAGKRAYIAQWSCNSMSDTQMGFCFSV